VSALSTAALTFSETIFGFTIHERQPVTALNRFFDLFVFFMEEGVGYSQP
jgi:hypothetical protein